MIYPVYVVIADDVRLTPSTVVFTLLNIAKPSGPRNPEYHMHEASHTRQLVATTFKGSKISHNHHRSSIPLLSLSLPT